MVFILAWLGRDSRPCDTVSNVHANAGDHVHRSSCRHPPGGLCQSKYHNQQIFLNIQFFSVCPRDIRVVHLHLDFQRGNFDFCFKRFFLFCFCFFNFCILFELLWPRKALDLWMAGCMIFVFAALGEFVVVKVLDVQYQYQINRVPKVLPMVNGIAC